MQESQEAESIKNKAETFQRNGKSIQAQEAWTQYREAVCKIYCVHLTCEEGKKFKVFFTSIIHSRQAQYNWEMSKGRVSVRNADGTHRIFSEAIPVDFGGTEDARRRDSG